MVYQSLINKTSCSVLKYKNLSRSIFCPQEVKCYWEVETQEGALNNEEKENISFGVH